jgi:heme exporter protein B
MSVHGLIIALKDLKVEFRTMRMIMTMVIFSLMVIMAFRFAFLFYDAEAEPMIIAPILWVTFTFAGMFGLVSSFAREKDTGSLEGLMLCPANRWSIYLGKLLSNLVLLLIVDFAALLFFSVFFDFGYGGNVVPLAMLVILGSVAFTVVGTLVAGMSVNLKGRESALTILMLPLIILTVLMPAITATSKALEGQIGDAWGEIRLIAMFSLVYLALSYLLFDYVLEA